MEKKNICKFVQTGDDGHLRTLNFVYESEAPSSPFRLRDYHGMYLIAEGQGMLYTETAAHPLSPGVLAFSFAGHAIRIENVEGLAYMYITFTGKSEAELFQRFGISSAQCCFAGYEGLLPLWQDRLVRASSANIDLLSASVLLYTFATFREESGGKSSPMDRVLHYIEEHYQESTLSLSTVAAAVGYHPKYLSHLFKKELNRGFADYVMTVRLNHAIFLIGQGVTSVKNLAILCGYTDPLYFSRVFRSALGASPREYIAARAKEGNGEDDVDPF